MNSSPMFQHAIESFEHGLEHFLDGTERSRKFALLHIDQAIELFLKEKCVRLGKSIYKTDGTTLSLHESFSSLKKEISIPEQPRLEELHDLRNTIQHKGLLPDSGTTKYYVDISYTFVKRFLDAELDTPPERVFSFQHRALMEGTAEPIETPQEILSALAEAKDADEPLSAIVSSYTVLERAIKVLAPEGEEKVRIRKTLRDAALARGTPRNRIDKALRAVFMIRGKAIHGDYAPTEKDACGMVRAVEKILGYVGFQIESIEDT